MNAKQLQIGNILGYLEIDLESGSEIIKNYPCTLNDISEIERGNVCNRYSEVLLTEEWLIKFGFVLNTDSNSFRIFSHKEEWILAAQQTGNKIEFKIGLPVNHRSDQYMTSFKYVHQLQNLYFALTGVELQLSST